MESRRNHPITIATNPHRVRVLFSGRVVVDTTRALMLTEASLPPVQYVHLAFYPDRVDRIEEVPGR